MMSEPTIREPEDIRRDCGRNVLAVVSEHFQAILGERRSSDDSFVRVEGGTPANV